MSRSKNALVATAFNYAQLVFGTLSAFYLTRLLIRSLGQDLYGMWLATGAVLGYAGLADLGIFGVMPWLFAEADGEKNREKMRSLLAHGVLAGLAGGAIYAVFALVLWLLLPRLLHLSEVDRHTLRGPVLVMAAITVAGYPLRLFAALRTGLQDYRFMGTLGLIQPIVTLVVTASFTLSGLGLYGIALGVAVPGILTGAASMLRTRSKDPELVTAWPRPSRRVLKGIVLSGTGAWFASIGWQLAFATDSVVIAFLGYRDLVPMFTVTSRLGLTLMQMSWTLPDSTSVGLAQLNSEGHKDRVADVIGVLLRLHLVGAGLIACGVLAGNFGFVTIWIGSDLFGGPALNSAFAIDVVLLSLVHGLVVPAAVLGQRLRVGAITLANGVVHIGLALALGRLWGLLGVALATALSAMVTSVPVGARLLAGFLPGAIPKIVTTIFRPWLARSVPVFIGAALAGAALAMPGVAATLGRKGAAATGVAVGVAAGFAYLLSMRPLMRDLPFGPKARRILNTFRLV